MDTVSASIGPCITGGLASAPHPASAPGCPTGRDGIGIKGGSSGGSRGGRANRASSSSNNDRGWVKRQARLPTRSWAPGYRAREFAENSAVSAGAKGDTFDGSDDGEEDCWDRLRAADEAEIALAEGRRKMLDPPHCLLYTSPSPRDLSTSRMPSSA